MQHDLVIPVYLNQRVVFDLVAMMQGGIATVTKLTEANREGGSLSAEAGGSFGLGQAFASLLRIDLSGKSTGAVEGGRERAREEERVHTPASLFFELRRMMIAEGVLLQDAEKATPKPGDFIEFSSSLKRNPLVESLETMIALMDMMAVFAATSNQVPRKGGGKGVGTGHGGSKPHQQYDTIKTQMKSFLADLKSGQTLDLTTDGLCSSYRAVVTLEERYLNDPTLSDLVDGTFRVAGKITRVVNEGEGSISLIRKAAVGRMPEQLLNQVGSAFEKLAEKQFSLPQMKWELTGPVIQVLPLAIFA